MSDVIVHLIDEAREVRRQAGDWLSEHAVEANVPATLLPREVRRAEAGERDLANPTSNGVYARLGYRMVAETAEWLFES